MLSLTDDGEVNYHRTADFIVKVFTAACKPKQRTGRTPQLFEGQRHPFYTTAGGTQAKNVGNPMLQ